MKVRLAFATVAGMCAALLLSTPASASQAFAGQTAAGEIQAADTWDYRGTYPANECKLRVKLWADIGRKAECRPNSDGVNFDLYILNLSL